MSWFSDDVSTKEKLPFSLVSLEVSPDPKDLLLSSSAGTIANFPILPFIRSSEFYRDMHHGKEGKLSLQNVNLFIKELYF